MKNKFTKKVLIVRYFILLAITMLSLNAQVHYAEIQPYSNYIIKSNVSGEVITADENMEGKIANSNAIITIDSAIDEAEQHLVDNKLISLNKILSINEQVLQRKEAHYDKIKTLRIKSQTDKDREFYDIASTKEKIQTIKQQLQELNFRKLQLQKNISDKHIVKSGFMVYKLLTKKGEVVNLGSPLVEVADIRKAKLTLFLNRDEIDKIKTKNIYINDEKSELTIDKVWSIADSKHLSAFRAEIIIPAPKQFSKLIKVEIK